MFVPGKSEAKVQKGKNQRVATRNKCIATRSKGLTSSNKKLLESCYK